MEFIGVAGGVHGLSHTCEAIPRRDGFSKTSRGGGATCLELGTWEANEAGQLLTAMESLFRVPNLRPTGYYSS